MTLDARYRMLLRAYPPAYRAERGDEVVGTYLELAGDRTRPRMSDVTDLLAAGLRERLRARGATGVTDALPLAATLALCAAARRCRRRRDGGGPRCTAVRLPRHRP